VKRTAPPASTTPADTSAAIPASKSGPSTPESRAASPTCAPSPSTLSARASEAAVGVNRASRSSTAFATPRGTMAATSTAAAAVGSTPRAAASLMSSPTKNGFPPVTSRHARTKRSSGSAESRVATSAATAACVRGGGRSISTVGSPTSAAASGIRAGSIGRVATMSASACPSSRRAMKPSALADGPSHHCRSSTTSASGDSAERFDANQYRPCCNA